MMGFSIQTNEEKMKVYIAKQAMRLSNKGEVSSVAILLFLFLLSSLISVGVYRVGETFRDCEMCPELVVLPAGEFTMGSPEEERGRFGSEGPQHRVTIPKPFAVGKYEVTVGQYAEFVRETKHESDDCYGDAESWRDPGFDQTENHPVVCVSWDDASAYANWLSAKTGHEYRLLTEAEWEYAARAGTTTAYRFGRMILDNMAQYSSDGTVAVGSYPENAFGLYDMHGSVWEWVEDCLHYDYTGAPTDGGAWLSGCDDVNKHMLRGGSWFDRPVTLRSAIRLWYDATDRSSVFGFRVARTLNP